MGESKGVRKIGVRTYREVFELVAQCKVEILQRSQASDFFGQGDDSTTAHHTQSTKCGNLPESHIRLLLLRNLVTVPNVDVLEAPQLSDSCRELLDIFTAIQIQDRKTLQRRERPGE